MYKDPRVRIAFRPDAMKKYNPGRENSCIISTVGVIERAFQLAEECTRPAEIRARLKREGYTDVDAHLTGGKIRSDLARVLRQKD